MADLQTEPNLQQLAPPSAESASSPQEVRVTVQNGRLVTDQGVEVDPSKYEVEWDEDKYGTLGAQTKLVAQEIAQGFAGPVATAGEKALQAMGVPVLSPEERAQAAAVNPVKSTLASALGLGAGLMTGTGEAAILSKAGSAGAKLLSAASEMSRARAAGAAALRGAIEMAGFSAGDEMSQWIAGNPNQTAESALQHIGLSSALGAALGAPLGAIFPKAFAEVAPEVEQNLKQFQNTVRGTVADAEAEAPLQTIKESGLLSRYSKLKPEAKEVIDIGAKHNWPVFEGMVSDRPEIQMAEDALLQGPPTVAGISRRQSYEAAADAVRNSIEEATAAPLAASETEVGNSLKQGLLDELSQRYQPIKDLYAEIEPYKPAIPVAERSGKAVAKAINSIIEEKGLVPGSERYNFLKTFSQGLENVENLAQLSNFKTEIGRSAGPLTKDLAATINEKLEGIEEKAIKRFAETMKTGEAKNKILGLIDRFDQARAGYAAFREELQTLGNSLGKKKIYGPQNFMDFIEELNPQVLAKRVFSKGNTEFADYLAKNFPNQMEVIRDYQRGLLKEAATKEGVLNTKALVKKIDQLPKELQNLLYSDTERDVIADAGKYLESFPKSFNPSGTAHMSAFRAFFEHPTGATIANLRDAGILAFIKAIGKVTPGAEKVAPEILKTLGPKIAAEDMDAGTFKEAVDTIYNAIKGKARTIKAADGIFTGAMPVINEASRPELDKLDQKLEKVSRNPQSLFELNANLGKALPDHASAMSQTVAQAATVLNGLRPQKTKAGPLDADLPLSAAQMAPYYRALNLAHDPLIAFKHIKNGTLQAQDVAVLQAMAPAQLQLMRQEVLQSLTKHVSKNKPIPYATRQSLSLFLGTPLDSTFKPESIQSIQATFTPLQGQQTPAEAGPKVKHSTAPLGHLPKEMMTASQAREARRNK